MTAIIIMLFLSILAGCAAYKLSSSIVNKIRNIEKYSNADIAYNIVLFAALIQLWRTLIEALLPF